MSSPGDDEKGILDRTMDWIAWAVPQDASNGLKLCPITSKLCEICSFLCVGVAIFVHATCEYADLRPAISQEEDPWQVWFLQLTATLALAGLVYELSIKASISLMGMAQAYREDLVLRNRLRLNMKIIVVFTVLTTIYHAMAFDIQWVHRGWLAEYYGGHQIIYSCRYIEWVTCAPIVFSISGQLPHAADGSPRNGIIPSSLLTGLYCIISWQGLVVKNVFAAWVCIGFAFFCYTVATLEQLSFAWYLKDQGRAGPLRAGLLVYIVTMCGVYGLLYLLPIPGAISPSLENKFYCVCDISFKLGTSIIVIATYDLDANEEMRRRAEATAEDLRRMVDTASVPIFGVDSSGKVDQWNQQAARILGFSAKQARGRSIMGLISEAKHAEATSMIRQALVGNATGYLETTMVTQAMDEGRGGQPAKLVLSASPRRDSCGIVGVTLVGCDFTEVEAFKEAEARKTRFMAVVSHELRSPLHGIIGLAERLEDDEMDSVKARWLGMVKNCASRLLDLVVNIMEMASLAQKDSQGNPKTLKLQQDPVELPKVIEEIVTLVRSSVDKTGHTLVKPGVELINKVRPGMPIIEADSHRCTQVFYNIVTNACKFTTKGSIAITSQVGRSGRWVEISIEDTGIGIPAGSVERIFQPFEQADSADNRHYQGVGLGLSIAQEVVRLHGGRIRVESTVGVGTTFAVRMPLAFGDSVEDEEDAEEAGKTDKVDLSSVSDQDSRSSLEPEVTRPTQVERKKPRVLSVDDDQVNQMVIESILQSEYDLVLAMDGPEALEYLESCPGEPPDCVLLDVMMPGMSGFEVCRTIRQKMRLSNSALPVVMLTANPSPTAQTEGFESGCNSYVTKPFDKLRLQTEITSAMATGKEERKHSKR